MENELEASKNEALTFASSAIQGAVQGLISTIFIRRNTAKTELEKIKSGKFNEVINVLLSEGKMSYMELYKCKNFFKVAQKADKYIHNKKKSEECHEQTLDFDWFMRFYDAVGNISREELQDLWGKILAGEILNSKACSLRTLDIIRNLSVEEAKIFNEICRYILPGATADFMFSAGFSEGRSENKKCNAFMQTKGMNYYDTVIPLLEAGLISQDHDLVFYFENDNKLEFHNDKYTCTVSAKPKKKTLLNEEALFLTTSGSELFNIIRTHQDFEFDCDYIKLCVEQMRIKNPKLIFMEQNRNC